MSKKSKNLKTLALVLNVYLHDENHLCESNTEKLVIQHALNKAFNCLKNVFSKDQPATSRAVETEVSPRCTWYSRILSRYTRDSGDSLCRNMMRVTVSRNWFVARSYGYYGDFKQHKQELANVANVLIKLKKYLELQKQRINSMSNLQSLKSLPAKNCADKSVQCSKSTEFLKPSSPDRNNRFISPSYRAIGDDKKQSHDQRQNYEMCGKYSHGRLCQPRLHSSRLSIRRRRTESCPECRESQILASVKRRIDEDLGGSRVGSGRTNATSSYRSSYVTACESFDSIETCKICEDIRRLHHRHHHCCNGYYMRNSPGTKPCYSVDSGIDLMPINHGSDDEFGHHDKEVQADLLPTRSSETISSNTVEGAVRKFTEDLIICERRAKENFGRKQRGKSLTPRSSHSSCESTWNYLKNLNSPSEDELISGISTPSLVSLSDPEDTT